MFVFIDLVDRGKKGLDILLLLFVMKLAYPNRIHILRGNHESISMSWQFGFAQEMIYKMSKLGYDKNFCFSMYLLVMQVFSALPIAAILNDAVYISHGGILE